MRFRLRLALAFVLLSALPLALLAVYSFTRSSAALRRAVEAEAELMASDLEQRVGGVAADVDRRIRALARLPTSAWLEPGTQGDRGVESQVLVGFAEALPFIENFRFVPRAQMQGRPAGREQSWSWTGGSPAHAATPPEEASDAASRSRLAAPVTAPVAAPVIDEKQSSVSAEQIEEALRAAEAGLKLARIPGNMPAPERVRMAAELEKARLEIGRSIAMRQEIRVARQRERVAAAAAPAAPAAPVAPEAPTAPPSPPATETATKAEVAQVPAGDPKGPDDELSCSVRENGEVVGEFAGKLKAAEILKSVLSQTDREKGEIPFALDGKNQLYVAGDADGQALKRLPAVARLRGVAAETDDEEADHWIVVARKDEASGLRFGIARPISRAMRDLKTETAFNFLAAFFLIGLTTVGMIPLTGGMVRKVQALEAGAVRIASGDLTTRVPVQSKDEFGQLAVSFNQMAAQLAENQERLLEQERIGKEREIARRLLEAENDRKSLELEEARRFQLSLLPRELPERPGLEIGVAMSTATEVGGDYYDFRNGADGALRLAIGDATGHGAAAGTMVTVVKSLFMASGEGESPAAFLRRSTGLVHGMGLARMAMALAVADVRGRRVTISSAGMPPALHFRGVSGEIDEVALPGMPLGTRAEFAYAERDLELATGDALLLMSDGFPELTNAEGEVLGYERARATFASFARRPAREIAAALDEAATSWAGNGALADDVTFLVLRAVAV